MFDFWDVYFIAVFFKLLYYCIKKLKIESILGLVAQNFVQARRTILEKDLLEYATADILISMLREAYFACVLFTDRRKKKQQPAQTMRN